MNKALKLAILDQFRFQADFCQKAGITEPLLSRIIHGRKEATSEEQKIISEALGLPPENLFPK